MSSGTKDALVFIGGMILAGGILALVIRGATRDAGDRDVADYDITTYPIEKGWGYTISRDGKLVHKGESEIWDQPSAHAAAQQYIREMLVGA